MDFCPFLFAANFNTTCFSVVAVQSLRPASGAGAPLWSPWLPTSPLSYSPSPDTSAVWGFSHHVFTCPSLSFTEAVTVSTCVLTCCVPLLPGKAPGRQGPRPSGSPLCPPRSAHILSPPRPSMILSDRVVGEGPCTHTLDHCLAKDSNDEALKCFDFLFTVVK